MKHLLQLGLLYVCLMAIIGGVTFVTHYIRNPPPKRETSEVLHFVGVRAPLAEYEVGTTGLYDFAFQNRQPHAVELGVNEQAGVCSGVQVAICRPEDWNVAEDRPLLTAAALGQALRPGLPDVLGPALAVHRLNRLAWQPIGIAYGTVAIIPGQQPGAGPTVGVVRVSWKGKQVGRERVAIELSERTLPRGRTQPRRLEVPVAFVPPVRVYPPTVTVGELQADGPPRTAQFWCWSSTRDHFPLSAAEATGDPCFEMSCAPLAPEECRSLAAKLAGANRPTHVASAYRVTVTVHERRPGAELLELGPLDRAVTLTSAASAAPLAVHVTGVVRGEVVVGTSEAGGTIDLGPFAAAEGTTSRAIGLSTDQPEVELSVAGRTPEYLGVKLEAGPPASGAGGKRWRLWVEVPPNRAAGPLPGGSAVYLKVQASSPRRIRIPVVGNAYR